MSLIKTLLNDAEKAYDSLKNAGLVQDVLKLGLGALDTVVHAETGLATPTVEQELAAIRQLATDHSLEGWLKAFELLTGRLPLPSPGSMAIPSPATATPAPAPGVSTEVPAPAPAA